VLGTYVAQHIKDGIAGLSPADQAAAAQSLGSGNIPHVSQLTDGVRDLVESAYGSGVGTVFLYSVPLAIITLIAVVFLPNARLGTMNAVQLKKTAGGAATEAGTEAELQASRKRELEDAEDILIEVSAATAALEPVGMATPTGSIRVVNDRDDVDAGTR
jgi:hypothetical protein